MTEIIPVPKCDKLKAINLNEGHSKTFQRQYKHSLPCLQF